MNKIKEFFTDWSWKEKACTDCTDSSLGNSERKSVYVGHDVDK